MRQTLQTLLRFLSRERPSEPAMDDNDDLDELLYPDDGLTKAERAKRREMRREKYRRILAEYPNHPTIEHIVDNRALLLGLDEMYRMRMKHHESAELLECARAVTTVLNVAPADVPIESYYWETRKLTEYFRLIRGLQAVNEKHRGRVSQMREFQRLLSVMSAPIYGRSVEDGGLFPISRDPLGQALHDTRTTVDGSQWTLSNLVDRAHRVAVDTQDFSLVGLAAFVRDTVGLAALRESVALYSEVATLSAPDLEPPVPVFVWRVDDELARRAAHFVATFNKLFDDDLPEPVAENGELYFEAAHEEAIIGRCICIGRSQDPERFYHWAVYCGDDGRPAVEEFWDTELWTSKRYSWRERP